MTSPPVQNVPVSVITGFLGVGKTTAIRAAFAHRPEHERWAVIVNEFGEVGIDGAALGGTGAAEIREIPGGCICCSAGVQLGTTLVRVLRETRPDRVLIEPTGLAMPSSVVDLLHAPALRGVVLPRATITLVDPVRFVTPRWAEHATYQAQVMAADVLVANGVDLCTEAQLTTYREAVASLWPPPLLTAETSHGELQAAWLDLDPAAHSVSRTEVSPHHHIHARTEAGRSEHDVDGVATSGWIFPTELVFDRDRLADALGELLVPEGLLEGRALRVKGVFRTPRTWMLLNGTADELTFRPVPWRRDSRLEIIVDGSAPNWVAVEAKVLSTLV